MTKQILIVGGGVIGTSVAWHLAERGLAPVTLMERDRLGSGTTSHSAGNITWKTAPDTDAPVDYMLNLIERLHQETDQDTGWRTTGRFFLARTEAYLERFREYHKGGAERGFGGTMVPAEDVADFHPLASPQGVVGGWLNPRSGRLNPADLVAAYAKGARARGVKIIENCAVEEVLIDNGRVGGARTGNGDVEADAVVVCSGLWSRRLLERADVHLAHGACEHFYVIAEPTPALSRDTPSFICPESLIYGREEVSGFLVGFFDREAKLLNVETLPEPFAFTLLPEDWDQIAPYYEAAAELFPALHDAPIRRFINGPESFTPDGSPLVGSMSSVEGLYVACALNSAGVTYSGMVGHNIADLLSGRRLRFTEIVSTPDRFGERGEDPGWVDAQMTDAPSRFYASHN